MWSRPMFGPPESARKCEPWTGYQFAHVALALAAEGAVQNLFGFVVRPVRSAKPKNRSLPPADGSEFRPTNLR